MAKEGGEPIDVVVGGASCCPHSILLMSGLLSYEDEGTNVLHSGGNYMYFPCDIPKDLYLLCA